MASRAAILEQVLPFSMTAVVSSIFSASWVGRLILAFSHLKFTALFWGKSSENRVNLSAEQRLRCPRGPHVPLHSCLAPGQILHPFSDPSTRLNFNIYCLYRHRSDWYRCSDAPAERILSHPGSGISVSGYRRERTGPRPWCSSQQSSNPAVSC